jgi:hypothetical protein
MKDRTRVRQGEYGRRTFLVLLVSTAIAIITAIFGFLYVETTPREEMREPVVLDAEVEPANGGAAGEGG